MASADVGWLGDVAQQFRNRARQLRYVCRHFLDHMRCVEILQRSGLAPHRSTSLKYLGNYMARDLSIDQRREGLITHYSVLPRSLSSLERSALGEGFPIWSRNLDRKRPDLRISLEYSKRGRMEGELQLRCSFESDLFVLTFMFAPGEAFGVNAGDVVFIGGFQGFVATRNESRIAAKLNEEISPAWMLLIALRAIAEFAGVTELIAVGTQQQICSAHRPSGTMRNYEQFWAHAGGERFGQFYRIPVQQRDKPLSDIPAHHRSRTRRKREAKKRVKDEILGLLIACFEGSSTHGALLAQTQT